MNKSTNSYNYYYANNTTNKVISSILFTQVGCKHGPGGPTDRGLTAAETRAHFGAWAIVSSPLVLSHDVNDKLIGDSIWDVISNKEVLLYMY